MIVYRKPGLAGLEIWHGLTADGDPLYLLRDSRPKYFEALCEFLERLHQGVAHTEEGRDGPALARAAGFQRAILCGGDALDPRLVPVLYRRSLPFQVTIDRGGPFSARPGAALIAGEMGWRRWVALDLGQTQLKAMTSSENWILPRDLSILPRGSRSTGGAAPVAIRAMLQDGFARARGATVEPVDGVILALPSEIAPNGNVEASSYPGLQGPVEELTAGLFDAAGVVVNDAVLAARGFPPADGAKTLVVTMGHGVGGAIWE